ncbi:hypothetical protein Tdes44962_MAKER06962 [Teratosphaeria destructans]|uniref:HAUS augmin-like complex subunit 1 n=1 Tax=Teratosphaeria destructans TaxID=418781 RepID=A0A9W7T008_9PEZI|nr:hypothetical protein Tdes44962_MAKER06962 [Teratosphaeria destructans]
MDSPGGDWSASALFSPSKARAQQAQAKDWAFVDAWLAKRYGKSMPSFERHEDTLQALLSLATVNEAADEQRALVERVEKAALQAGANKRSHESDEVYNALVEALSSEGLQDLEALAELAVMLGTTDVRQMGVRVSELTDEQFELSEQVRQSAAQEAALEREMTRLKNLLGDLGREDFQAPADLPEQTAEWMRTAKQMKAKLGEYEERLSALRGANSASPSVEEVLKQARDVELQRQRLADLGGKLAAFDDLPSDPTAARTKLEAARNELRLLTRRRDELFENMAGR